MRLLHSRARAAAVLCAFAGLGAVLLAGCGGDAAAGGGESRYIAGDGGVTVVPPGKRGNPVALKGSTLDGSPLNVAALRGNPVVLNVWASWCAPCRKEAPILQEAYEELKAEGVAFVGLNTQDPSIEPAQAFERTYDITYPSLYDDKGRLLLALHGAVPPNSLPTTLILDAEGRIAARVTGAMPSKQTLVDLVDDARAA